MMLYIAIIIIIIALFLFLSGERLPSASTPATGTEAGKTSKTRIEKSTGKEGETPSNVLDLADWPGLLDTNKVETFFEECSKAFPQQREICLPLAMTGRVVRSTLPLKEELRLIETLRQVDRVQISTRVLPPELHLKYSFDVILFEF